MFSIDHPLFYLFIIFFSKKLLTASNTDLDINFQNFYINSKDLLSINVDKFLSPGKLLNDLEIDSSKNLNLEIPRNYKKEIFEDEIENYVLDNMQFLTSYDKFVSFLYRKRNGNLTIQLKNINFEDQSIDSKFYYFGSSDLKCGKIWMDDKNIYGSCISKFEKTMKLCFKNYVEDFVPVCEDFDLGIEQDNFELSFEDPRMDFFTLKNLKKKYFVFFFKNSRFSKLQNLFILFDGEKHARFELGREAKIKKIRILNYNNSSKVFILLIMVELNGKNELRHYKIIDFKFSNEKLSYKLIKNEITNFIYEKNSLVIIKKNKTNLEFYDVNLEDLSWKIFYLQKEKQIKKIFLSNKFIIFQIINEEDKYDIFIFDLFNKRFFRIDDMERKTSSKNTLTRKSNLSLNEIEKIVNDDFNLVLVQYGDKSFFFEFQKGSTFCFELNRFQYVKIKSKDSMMTKSEGRISFQINDEVYYFNIFFEGFDMLKKNNFEKIIFLNPDDDFNEIKIDLYQNNMIFGKKDPIKYFDEIYVMIDVLRSDKDVCNILNSLISKSNYIKICAENEIWLYKNYTFNKSKEIIFENKSVLKVNIDLEKILFFKLFFDQFLLLLTENMEIIYFDINSNKIEIKKNNFLQTYSKCVYEKNHIICIKEENIYFFIEIQYKNNDLKFFIIKTMELHNIILKSFIIPTNRPKDITYLRYSQRSEDWVHLETLKKGNIAEKFISNFNFKSTFIFEVGFNNYISLKTLDFGGYELFCVIGKNLIHFPRSLIDKILTLLDYSVVKGTNIFTLLYKTYDNKYRLFVGRCALNVYQRIIQDFEISGKKMFEPKVNSIFLDENRILFNVFDLGVKFTKFYIFYLNGPFFIIENSKHFNKANLTLNKHNLSFSIQKTKNGSPKIKTKEILIGNCYSKKGYLTYNLEEQNNFVSLGDLIKVDFTQKKKEKKFEFHRRLKFYKYQKIIDSKKGYKMTEKFSFKETKNSFSLFVQNFLYVDEIIQQNYDYHGCKFVHSRLEDESIGEIYMCKNNKNNLIEITNFKDFNIRLKDYIKSFHRVQLIQVRDFIFIGFINNRYKGIDLWKFSYNKKVNKQNFIFKKTFFSDDFLIKESYIKYFYMFEKKKHKTIVFFITNFFDNNFVIKELDIESNTFNKKKKILYNYKKKIINHIYCKHVKKKFTCLINSQNLIYDLQIQEKKNKWKLNLNAIYKLPKSISVTEKISFNISEKYVGVLFPPSETHDLFLFLRNKKKINDNQKVILPKNIYAGIKTPVESVFKELIFKTNQDGEDFLLVGGLNNPKKGYSLIYEQIFINYYKIDQMKLIIKMDELDYKQKLKFRASFLNENYQNFDIILTDNHNINRYIMIIVLSLLICVLIILIIINIFIYRKNKILSNENEFLTESNNFMDQTNLQF